MARGAEVADDRRERGGDDRLVERGEQQPEHDRREHDVLRGAVDDRRLGAPCVGVDRDCGHSGSRSLGSERSSRR